MSFQAVSVSPSATEAIGRFDLVSALFCFNALTILSIVNGVKVCKFWEIFIEESWCVPFGLSVTSFFSTV